MLLAVDIGNTNITLGLVDGGSIVATRRAGTHRATTVDELELLLDGLLALDDRSLDGASGAVLVSVVPSQTALVEAVADRRGIPILVAAPGTIPIAIRVDRPGEVGRTGSSTRSPPNGSTAHRRSSWTWGRPRPTTAWAPTARSWAARSRRA